MEIEKKYYATNLKALSLGECIRLGGGVSMGLTSWVLGRFLPPQGKVLMPTNFAEIEASEDDLSERLRERIRELAKDFFKNGFTIVAYQKLPVESENTFDSGGCVLLSANGEIAGTINIVIHRDANVSSGVKYTEALSVGCFDVDGNGVGIQSTPGLDPKKGSRTIIKKGADLNTLLEELNRACKKWKKKCHKFSDWDSLRDVLQKAETETFLYRRDVKKLFIEVGNNESSIADKKKEIEDFWQWFESNQNMFLSMNVGDRNIDKIVSQVGKKLEKVGPLAHEFCLEDKNGKRDFIVSANGIEENISLVEKWRFWVCGGIFH
jgi:hypothetical protein